VNPLSNRDAHQLFQQSRTRFTRPPKEPGSTDLEPMTSADSPLDRPALPEPLPEVSSSPAETDSPCSSLHETSSTGHPLSAFHPKPSTGTSPSQPKPTGLETDFRLPQVTLSVLSTRRLVLPLPESQPAGGL
jgi:hypothetical protein